MSNTTPLFRFGAIADIQYADIEDAMNFSKTENRCYRGTLQHTHTAVAYWNQQAPKLAFVAQLGDLIDGQNSGTYGQGLSFDEPQTQQAFKDIMEPLLLLEMPVYHAIGNHELYNFKWAELQEQLNIEENNHCVSQKEFYFAFQPHAGWTCIVINGYAVSVMQDETESGHQKAVEILKERNTNFQSQGKVDYFEGLEGLERRFVPFNGGLGEKQLLWLKEEVSQAVERGDRIVLFSHLPLYEEAASAKNLAYDYDKALHILHNEGAGKVVAVFAGHYHQGGYAQDASGIHHLTLKAPLTHGLSFGCVDVYTDRLEFVGQGAQPSFTLGYT